MQSPSSRVAPVTAPPVLTRHVPMASFSVQLMQVGGVTVSLSISTDTPDEAVAVGQLGTQISMAQLHIRQAVMASVMMAQHAPVAMAPCPVAVAQTTPAAVAQTAPAAVAEAAPAAVPLPVAVAQAAPVAPAAPSEATEDVLAHMLPQVRVERPMGLGAMANCLLRLALGHRGQQGHLAGLGAMGGIVC